MNLTELARILKVTPQELKEKLPRLGFDIGQKAIKIDKKIAQKIIQEWSRMNRRLREEDSLNEAANASLIATGEKKSASIPKQITVKDFAVVLNLPVNKILAQLMKSGIFISLNEKMDFDTASIIGSDLGFDISLSDEASEEKEKTNLSASEIISKQENLSPRSPIIVVMGHVDHGKTKLLDAIREANVVAGEAGGITQHIGAYQVERKGSSITFIDTPGHEAFTAMRGRGAKIADIAILVVAADDGVKPQTVEAFQIIKNAGLSFVVAINKIDKPEADINRTKQDLATKLNITPEDWGGKTPCVPVSALNKIGIEELLDTVLLVAEVENENMRANPDADAMGTIIESRIDKGEGPVATILVQNGTLREGDDLILDGSIIGKVRALKNWRGEKINEAGPAVPAKIIGLKMAPKVGDIVSVGVGERTKIKKLFRTAEQENPSIKPNKENDQTKKINIIIKSDVLGSGEAIEESLAKIDSADIKAQIISKGLGNISEGDLKNAEASGAMIIGFNVKTPPAIQEISRNKKITIKTYTVIYHLLNDIKEEMENMLEPEIKRTDLGTLKVLAIFKTEKDSQVIGGKIISGRAELNSLIEVYRDEKMISKGKITKLQAGKQDVSRAEAGQECGIQYQGDPIVQAGDELNFYKEEKIKKIL